MADYDNGLSPEGADISNVKIDTVLSYTDDSDTFTTNKIGGITFDKEPAGKNTAMFL